jgi:hypothetical protein
MTTLGQEIVLRYTELTKKVVEIIGEFPLPKLGDDVSLSDFIVYVIMEWSPLYKPDGKDLFKSNLNMLLRLKGVKLTAEQFDAAYPHIDAYLMWLIPLLRERGG